MQAGRRIISIVTFVLIMIGVVLVYSSSAIYAHEKFGNSLFFLKRHLFFLGVGALFMFYLMAQDIKKIEAYEMEYHR